MSFRPLKPASPGRGSDDPQPSRPSRQHPRSRNRDNVVQACDDCRRTKVKCDGKWPKCSNCVERNRPCGYVGGKGQSRAEAYRSRLDALEKLMASLQTSPPDQAHEILQRIRNGDQLQTIVSSTAPATTEHGAAAATTSAGGGFGDTFNPRSSGVSPGDPASPEEFAAREPRSSFSSSINANDRETSMAPRSHGRNRSEASTTSNFSIDQKLNLQALAGDPLSLVRTQLPPASVTKQAIDMFFDCSGKLFHVFTRDQIAQFYGAVYETRDFPTEHTKAQISCLMAAAAVGAQYMPDSFSRQVESGFYELSRYYFEFVVEHQPLHAIKVCTLLAQYSILNKALISLAYVEVGLALSRLHGLGNEALRSPSTSNADWLDLRKTWRTLVFFSSWLSSTLGYISGNDMFSGKALVSIDRARIPLLVPSANFAKLAEMRLDSTANPADVVEAEMARICILKANVLRMHMIFKDLTAPAVQTIMTDLQTWHRELPETMQLEAISREDLPPETRRSILHTHLLYLGSIMLLYRRIASQFLRTYMNTASVEGRPPSTALQMPLNGVLAAQGIEASLAASTSARIVRLMLEDESIFKRCWLIIFQTYTTCTILLHSAVQKQLHNFPPSTWESDKSHVSSCLSVLAFCGSGDPIAAKFHDHVRVLFDRVFAEETAGGGGSEMAVDLTRWGELGGIMGTVDAAATAASRTPPHGADPGYLLHIPADADEARVRLSLSLLVMLSQPFGDPSNREPAEHNIKQHWTGDPTRYEYPQMVERLDWNYESSIQFRWDLDQLNLPSLDLSRRPEDVGAVSAAPAANPLNWFVGSDHPSGWT